MKYSYIQPDMNSAAKIFLLDSKGKHVSWPSSVITNADYWGERVRYEVTNNGYALLVGDEDEQSCRESLCNSFADFILKLTIPLGYQVTLKSPSNSRGRSLIKDTSEFSLLVSGSSDGSGSYCHDDKESQDATSAVLVRAYELLSSKANLTDMYALTDVLMGVSALLIGGPGAYARTRTSKNHVDAYTQGDLITGSDYKWDAYKQDYVKVGSDGTGTGRSAHAVLDYTGVSNFWMKHPATLSLMSGLHRFGLELWIDGKFEEIDEDIGIDATRLWLAKLSAKKGLTKTDKAELLEVMSWFRAYFSSAKVKNNPGAYPINNYTWGMFVRFTKQAPDEEGGFYDTWKSQGNIYGLCNYGFYTWCKKQKSKTKRFIKRPSAVSWGGLVGNMVSFSG
jgi:hypothetical protein